MFFPVRMYRQEELLVIRDAFLLSLRHASEGQPSSLPFITNPLPPSPIVTDDTPFQVIVVGGTNYTSALVKKTSQHIQILDQFAGEVPSFQTADVFCSFFATLLRPDVSVLAVNFAYPLKPIARDGQLDGILLGGSKGQMKKDLVGQKIGELLENYLLTKTERTVSVYIANDIVCLILSGLDNASREDILGLVVGTGVNAGFFIDSRTVVNLQSAQFHDFVYSPTGKQVDAASHYPGRHPFEKEIAGRYLYRHYNILVEELQLNTTKLIATQELSEIAQQSILPQSEIAQDLLKRSASLVAAQIAAIYQYKNRSTLTVLVEGAVFWRGYQYKTYVGKYLRHLGVPDGAVSFVGLKDSSVIGAAHLLV